MKASITSQSAKEEFKQFCINNINLFHFRRNLPKRNLNSEAILLKALKILNSQSAKEEFKRGKLYILYKRHNSSQSAKEEFKLKIPSFLYCFVFTCRNLPKRNLNKKVENDLQKVEKSRNLPKRNLNSFQTSWSFDCFLCRNLPKRNLNSLVPCCGGDCWRVAICQRGI